MKRKFNKIFGIGLTKTGTHSLNRALKKLGFKSVHNYKEDDFMDDLFNGRFKTTSIMKEIDALTHIEASLFFEQWDINYPNSKFILTLRHDSENGLKDWLDSQERHYFRVFRDGGKKYIGHRFYMNSAVWGCIHNNKRYVYVYKRHYREVKRWFKDRPDDLLILNINTMSNKKMSIKLCKFLDVPIKENCFQTMYVNWKYKSKYSDERRNIEIKKLRNRHDK